MKKFITDEISKLTEGEIYSFRLTKTVELPPDNEENYIFESYTGSKHLVKKELFAHYNLKPEQIINCKVDKINCSGKIFLEPEHPYCKPGDVVEFTLLKNFNITNSFGENENIYMLEDPWKNISWLNTLNQNIVFTNNKVFCKTERIKKGKLLISHPDIQYIKGEIKIETWIDFQVNNIFTLGDNQEYMLLTNKSMQHFIRNKFAKRYNVKKGDIIRCFVTNTPSLFNHYLEAENPEYKVGNDYSFEFIKVNENNDDLPDDKIRIVVRDKYGVDYNVIVNNNLSNTNSGSVRLLVRSIRLSRLILEQY